jgi:TolB protein
LGALGRSGPLVAWVGLVALGLVPACKRDAADKAPRPAPTARPDHAVASSEVKEAAGDLRPLDAEERAGLPGKLVFLRERDGVHVPHLVDPDGSGLRELRSPTGTGAAVMAASRDGRHLALIAAAGEGDEHVEQLFLWPLPDGAPRPVSPRSGRARSPAFSPDGRRLAFESGHEAFSNVYVVGVDGEGLTRVTDAPEGDFEPTWSPDGGWLAFVSSREGDPEIFRVRPDGTGLERLTAFHQEDTGPLYSPVKEQVAFLSDRGGHDALYVMNAHGAAQRRVGPPGVAREPTWSPDGTRLAVVVRQATRQTRIAIVDAATGASTFITPGDAVNDMPTWSPDGRHLAFVSDRQDGRPQLYLVRADGSGTTPLLADPGADWLPLWIAAP